MDGIRKLVRIELLVIVLFVVFKAMRKSVLENDPAKFIEIFLLSFPNFCEGVVGVLIMTMIGLLINRKLKIHNGTIYLLATFLAAVYVITQELKIHNLGGNNIYDPNDLIFSILGLSVGYVIVRHIKPTLPNKIS